jgi:hypothetical protein
MLRVPNMTSALQFDENLADVAAGEEFPVGVGHGFETLAHVEVQRDAAFLEPGPQQLVDLWNKGWGCFLEALNSLKEGDLLKTIYIRDESLSVIDAINRQLAHYPYHIGQIVYIGRLINNENWKSLSIPKKGSLQCNQGDHVKDPAKKFSR